MFNVSYIAINKAFFKDKNNFNCQKLTADFG